MLDQADWTEENKVRALHNKHEAQVKEKQNKSTTKTFLLKLIDKFKQARVKGKGFLTKEGKFFNYHEWHAAAWGSLLMLLYFRLEQGLFLILFVAGIIKVWKDTHRECNDMSYFYTEIGKNLHYYVASGFVTAEMFLLTGDTAPEVGAGLIATGLKVVFGL